MPLKKLIKSIKKGLTGPSYTTGGSYWDSSVEISWNLNQTNSGDNYETSNAERCIGRLTNVLNILR